MGGKMSKQEESQTHTVTFNGQEVARSNACQYVEGNWYFPPDTIDKKFFTLHDGYHTTCGWKGTCDYYNLQVGDKKAPDAAWVYEETKSGASAIKGYWAFYKRNGLSVK